jgi:hypothetical protein
MVKGYPWFNALFKAVINNPVIMVDTGLVNPACSIGQNAAPGYRKTKIRYVEFFNKVNILLVAIIKIAGYCRLIAIKYFAFFALKVSHIDGPLPSASHEPSICRAAVETPQAKSSPKSCLERSISRLSVSINLS